VLRSARMVAALMTAASALAAVNAHGQAYCAPPKKVPSGPPPSPPPAVCQPQVCNKCTTSPCYVDSGIYVNDAGDLSIPTNGFPLLVARHYDSSLIADGPLGFGWTSSLTPHLYYATYLFAANTYQYEANIVMPDGARYRFTANSNGTFTPPGGRRDTLVRNANGTFTMTLQRSRSVYAFAADGSLTSMTDDYGNALGFTYDGNGRVQSIADASGSSRALSIAWNPQGRIGDVSDSSSPARHIVYSYNADGTLAGVRDPVTPSGQQSTSYTYTAGRFGPVLSRIDDRWGRVVSRLTWQPDGKLSSYTDGDYNDANPPASVGEKYTYSYGNGSTAKAHSLGNNLHTYTANGLITDHAQYDAASGNVTSSTDGAGVTTTYQYDGRGNVSVMNRGGVSWFYTYDPAYPDQVSTITPKDPYGNVLTNFASWVYEYCGPGDPAPGALKRAKRYDRPHTTTQTMAEYTYDGKGHVLTATNEFFRVSTFTYNASGDRITETADGRTTTYGYDPLGRVVSSTDALGHTTSYTYDALDRVLTVTLPRPSSASALNFVTAYSYDNLDTGIVYVNVTDANGRVTKTGYDALGHVVRTVDAIGNATQFGYQYNVLHSITDANNNVTTYGYDANRNLLTTTFPDGARETLSSAWDGTLLSVVDRRGTNTEYIRDAQSRIATIRVNGGNVVSYSYDGEMLSAAAPGFTYSYDNFWRLQTETRAGDYTITYQNLPNSPAVTSGYTVSPPAGQTWLPFSVSYGFDAAGRINTITAGAFGNFGIEYNALGVYSRITYPNGQTREFTYDDQGRLTTLRNAHPNTGDIAVFQYDYDYDWTAGAYSMLGQRTSLTMSGPGTYPSQFKYGYDADYQLTSATQGTIVRTWSYDAIGNRIYENNITPYTYYKNGTNPLNGQRLRNDGRGGDLTYDANGNTTGRGGTTLYTWDYANRLTSFAGTSYTYDHLGRRTSATAAGTTTKYFTLDLNTLAERASTAPTNATPTYYVFAPGIDEPLARVENGAMTYYSVDGLGTAVATTDGTGTVLGATFYDPWGVTSALRAPVPGFGYTGREPGGSLWYLRARYYDPAVGRFISEDPIGLAGGINVYSYVRNSPARYTDPRGLDAEGCDMIPWCFETPRTLNCCYEHDVCYARNHCTAKSWLTSWPPPCYLCNLRVACCFSGVCTAPPAPPAWIIKARQNDPGPQPPIPPKAIYSSPGPPADKRWWGG